MADASHELKTPIAVIMANAEALEKEPEEKKWLNNIKSEADRMNELVTSLLDLAKLEEGKDKEITILHFGLWFVHYALYALIPFFAVLFGSDAVQRILEMIPDVIMNGLTVAGNMLPAVGMAMLLQMLWNNKIAIYFLLGFILVAYLDLPLIAIAVLGTIIAVVTAQRDMQLKNNQAAPVAAVEKMSEEEDFFA